MNLRQFIFVIIICFGLESQSQNWQVIESERFRYYTSTENESIVYGLDSIFTSELRLIEKRVSYYLNGKLDIVISEDAKLLQRLKENDSTYASHNGGSLVRAINSLILDIYLPPNQMIAYFRQELTKKIISEMLYGGTLSDILKYDQGGYLPKWLLDGLFLYLSTGWTSELDSEWRIVYEKNASFNTKNHPNAEIQMIKGASFWHFIDQEFGSSAISSLLYFSRLSRKFSKAIRFVLKATPLEINRKWNDFYSIAYQRDFAKRIPINGMSIKSDIVYDYQIFDENSVLLLKNLFFGTRLDLIDFETKKLKKRYKISGGYKPIKDLHSSIQVVDGNIHVLMKKRNVYYDIQMTGNKHIIPLKRITSASSVNDGLILIEANYQKSYVYFKHKDSKKIDTLYQFPGYIESFDSLNNTASIFIVSSPSENLLLLRKSNTIDTLIKTQKRIYLPYFYNEDKIIFNFDNNGVVNGCILSLDKKNINFLTDYRVNISSHRYSNNTLLEQLTTGKTPFLFKTNYMGDTSLEIKPNLTPTYFYENAISPFRDLVAEPDDIKFDSIVPYEFMTPVSKYFDYTETNADSIERFKGNRQMQIRPLKPKLHVSSFFLQLNNYPIENQQIAYFESLPNFLPTKVSIFLGSIITDQFKRKHTFLGFNGLTSVGNYDVVMKQRNLLAGNKSCINYSLLFRNRKIIDNNLDKIFDVSTFIPKIGYALKYNSNIQIQLNAYFRMDQKNINYNNFDNYNFNNAPQNIYGLEINNFFKFDNEFGRSTSLNIKLNPYIASTINLNTKASFTYKQILNSWSTVRTNIAGGWSVGQNPTFFMLGGSERDLLGGQFTDQQGTQINPALFDFIFGIRGFTINHRGGDKFFNYNLEFDINPIEKWAGKAFWDQFFNSINFHVFTDGGIAFLGSNMYDRLNPYSFSTVLSRNDYVVRMLNYQNPFLFSGGVGVSFSVINYDIKLDVARGLEFKTLGDYVLHINLGHKF